MRERLSAPQKEWRRGSARRRFDTGRMSTPRRLPTLTGVVAWGAGPLGQDQLDLTYYAIHVVELLYAVLGPGCEEVTRTHTDGVDVIVGKWKGGKTGEVRAVRPDSDYGVLVFREGGKAPVSTNINDSYRPLVAEIVKFFETKRPPVPNEETLEIMEFMDAAQRSLSLGGAPVKLR